MRHGVLLLFLGVSLMASAQKETLEKGAFRVGLSYWGGIPSNLNKGFSHSSGYKPTYEDKHGVTRPSPSQISSDIKGVAIYGYYSLLKWMDAYLGLQYRVNSFRFDKYPNRESYSNLYIPLGLRMHFLRYLYADVGTGYATVLDKSNADYVNVSTGSRVYACLGLGIKYEFKFGVGIFANYWIEGLLETGAQVGLTYAFRRKK